MTTAIATTSMAKDELSRETVIKPCCRKAEISAMLRLAAGMQCDRGGLVIEAELDTGAAARRLQAAIAEAFGYQAENLVLTPGGSPGGRRYLVRISDGRAGANLARQAGLVGAGGRPVAGLPVQVVSGAGCDCAAAWRGAFLAAGSLTQARRSMTLEITCPGFEAALALAGAARRLGIPARTRDVHGVDRVTIKDGDAIMTMLTRMGAHRTVLACESPLRVVCSGGRPAANIENANRRRCEEAAQTARARALRAFEILGEDAPEQLIAAGQLRIRHPLISLTELAETADPPLSKDALTGRIRRLLARADHRAAEQGIPGTQGCAQPRLTA
jgi:cell division protein WhiA